MFPSSLWPKTNISVQFPSFRSLNYLWLPLSLIKIHWCLISYCLSWLCFLQSLHFTHHPWFPSLLFCLESSFFPLYIITRKHSVGFPLILRNWSFDYSPSVLQRWKNFVLFLLKYTSFVYLLLIILNFNLLPPGSPFIPS